jgi:hypothetical protein
MPYPECCLKGIDIKDAFSDDGELASCILYFKEAENPHCWRKQSINWQDDDDAIGFTLGQINQDGSLQFRFGLIVLSRQEIDRVNNRPQISRILSYEREELPHNRYHGNLLLATGVSKKKMKQVAATLAMYATEKTIPADGHCPSA